MPITHSRSASHNTHPHYLLLLGEQCALTLPWPVRMCRKNNAWYVQGPYNSAKIIEENIFGGMVRDLLCCSMLGAIVNAARPVARQQCNY